MLFFRIAGSSPLLYRQNRVRNFDVGHFGRLWNMVYSRSNLVDHRCFIIELARKLYSNCYQIYHIFHHLPYPFVFFKMGYLNCHLFYYFLVLYYQYVLLFRYENHLFIHSILLFPHKKTRSQQMVPKNPTDSHIHIFCIHHILFLFRASWILSKPRINSFMDALVAASSNNIHTLRKNLVRHLSNSNNWRLHSEIFQPNTKTWKIPHNIRNLDH